MSSILKVDEIQNTDGKTGIVITPDGTVTVPSVKFPEITGGNPDRVVTSTTMSSFEQGEYTATLTAVYAGTITLNSSRDTMSYTKVGRQVTISGRVNIQSVSSPSGPIQLNLPFTPAGSVTDHGGYAMISVATHGITIPVSAIQLFAEVNPSDKSVVLFYVISNSPWLPLDSSNLTGSGTEYIHFSGSYLTDE